MGVLAVLNAYSMRVCLSIAITEMAVQHKNTSYSDNSCPIPDDENRKDNVTKSDIKRYDWSEETQVKCFIREFLFLDY